MSDMIIHGKTNYGYILSMLEQIIYASMIF
jgi:hypothetical protein